MNCALATPSAIAQAIAVLRVGLLDFVFPHLAAHVERMRELRKATPNDPFLVCLDKTAGEMLIPVLSELHDEEAGGVSLSMPFNLALPRDIALAFVNLIAHVLFLEGLQLSVGFANAQGHGFVFRITGIDDEGKADVKCNELQGRIEMSEAAN